MLATYQNEKGECFPSQAELAEKLGVAERTVRRHIKKLVEYRLPNNAVIFEKTKKKGLEKGYYFSYYKFSFESGLRFGNEDMVDQKDRTQRLKQQDSADKTYRTQRVKLQDSKDRNPRNPLSHKEEPIKLEPITKTKEEEPIIKPKEELKKEPPKQITSKDIISKFRQLYKDKYGVEYPMNKSDWGRFGKLFNAKLIGNYEPEIILGATEAIFANYDERWKKNGFERPSLWNYTTFVFTQAVAIAQDNTQKAQENAKRYAEAQRLAEASNALIEDEEDVLALLNSIGN